MHNRSKMTLTLAALCLATLVYHSRQATPVSVRSNPAAQPHSHSANEPIDFGAPYQQLPGNAVAKLPDIGDPPAAPGNSQSPHMPDITAFDAWLDDFMAGSPAERAAMEEEGINRARARRPEFKKLIVADPRKALAMAVRRVVRQDLPASVLEHLEKPVSARGDFKAYFGRPINAAALPPDEELVLRYFETPAGESYKARVFGALMKQTSYHDATMRGVAMDREFAVAENPVRELEKGERIPAGTVVDETCPVSKITTPVSQESVQTVNDETPYVEVGGRLILLCNGTHVRVFEESQRMASGGPGVAGYFKDNFPGTSSEAIGNFRCLYIRVTYPDQMRAPNTEASAQGDMRNVSRYYLESSFGRMTATTAVTPLVVLPHTKAWYIAKDSEVDGLGLVHSHSRSEARKMGYDSGQYNCTVVRVNEGPRLSGISWGGGDSVWVSWDGMDVLNHECGHSLGRNHANYWKTTDGSAIGVGANEEYGNSTDVMGGGGGFGAHYNSFSKRTLGWLPDTNIHRPGNTAASSGIYRLYAYDQPVLEEGKRYSLRVDKDPQRRFYLEYRPAAGGEWTDSMLMIMSGLGSNAGHLVDTTPGSSGGKGDGGIRVGRTFSDFESDLHFTVLSKQNTTPPSLDMAMMRGPFPGNVAPVINSLTASAVTVPVNGSLTFTANATDANGDTLAYHWDFSDRVVTTNTPSLTRTFPAADQQTVELTVSDMKGGTARRHEVITIGNPSRAVVRGRITLNALPLMGVRISSDSKYCFTDTHGDYALADLSTGSRTLAASLVGYTFAAGFSNPFTLAIAGANNKDWTATSVAEVSITATSTEEGGVAGRFVLARTGSLSAPLPVLAAPFSGSAIKTTDYTTTPPPTTTGTLDTYTIPAGQESLAIVLTAVNDSAQEGPETVQLQLAAGAYQVRNSGISLLTIADNDTTRPVVRVETMDPYATETPGDAAIFLVTRTGGTSEALNLTAGYSGTATRGSDYPLLPNVITIPAGQASAQVSLVATDDTTIEIPEEAILTLAGGAAYILDPAASVATVNITDNDLATVTVSVPDDTLNEAGRGSGTVLLTRTGNLSQPLKVYYGLSGRALHGTDYIALSGEVTFAAGMQSVPVLITPYDDEHGEGDETIIFNLTSFNHAYTPGSNYSGTLTIKDNTDPPLVTVTANSASEPSTNGTFTFTITTTSTAPLSVNYTLGGTATAGQDFTTPAGSFTITPTAGAASSAATVSIPVINDAAAENTETVILTISPGPGYRIFNDGMAHMRMKDDDSEPVAVSSHSATLAEPSSASSFYVSRLGTAGALSVNYTISGTATNGTDYTRLTGPIMIPDGATGVDLSVTPINDTLAEGVETVILTLGSGPGYGIEVPSATLYLGDDDSTAMASVGFVSATASTSETPDATNGEFRSVAVTLSAAQTREVTAEFTAAGGSAAGDDIDWSFVDETDALITRGLVTFPAGSVTQNLRLKVRNDGIIEGNETAVLELRNVNGARVSGSRNKHTLTITDNNSANPVPRVSFLVSDTSRSEADGNEPLLIAALDAPATSAVTVNYSVTGTATQGEDFTLADGTLTFNPGTVSKMLPLVILADATTELAETVIVTLTEPAGAVLGTVITHTLKITDSNAPVLGVQASAPELSEDTGTGIFTVSRAGGSNAQEVTASYSLTGTALNGTDYTAATGTITIPANQNAASVVITPVIDTTQEPDKTVVLTLLPDVNYEISLNRESIMTILDDDLPPDVALVSPTSAAVTIPAGVGLYAEVTASREVPSGIIQMPVAWSQVSGPASAILEHPAARRTGITFPLPGTYIIRASATHGVEATMDLAVAVGITGTPPVAFSPSVSRLGNTPAAAGFTFNATTGAYNITGGGSGIASSGTADQFLFLEQAITGNCTMTARIVSIGTGSTSLSDNRSGLMIRENAKSPGSPQALMALTKAPASRFISRVTADSASTAANGASTFPSWVRITRTGDVFKGETAPDLSGAPGVWTQVGNRTIPMNAAAFIGIASASGSSGTGTVPLVVDKVKLLNYVGVSNVGPQVDTGAALSGNGPFFLDASLNDDGLPTPVSLTTSWSTFDGPGEATFANPSAVDTGITLPEPGLYTLRLSANDSQITTFDDAMVNSTGSPIESWRLTWFGADAANPAVSADLVDFDQDGLSNLVEYALNSDPKKYVAGHSPFPALSENSLIFTYRLNLSATDITAVVQSSPDLNAWIPATAIQSTLSDDGQTRVIEASVPINTPRIYLRLHVTR